MKNLIYSFVVVAMSLSSPNAFGDGPIERQPPGPGQQPPVPGAPKPKPTPAPKPVAPKPTEPNPAPQPPENKPRPAPARPKPAPVQPPAQPRPEDKPAPRTPTPAPRPAPTPEQDPEDSYQEQQPDNQERPGSDPDNGQNGGFNNDLEGYCGSLKKLDADCMLALSQSDFSVAVFDSNGQLNREFLGLWEINRILEYRDQDRVFLSGFNQDGSRSGPLWVGPQLATVQNWGYRGSNYRVQNAFEAEAGIFAMDFAEDARFNQRQLVIECGSPRIFEGTHLICKWSQSGLSGGLEFKGYLDLVRGRR